jgi:hypothetical protein
MGLLMFGVWRVVCCLQGAIGRLAVDPVGNYVVQKLVDAILIHSDSNRKVVRGLHLYNT